MTNPSAPAYSPGLEGVIAGESAICQVNSNAGLIYRGYDAHELAARARFEDVAYLLLRGELPTASQAREFSARLAESAELPAQVVSLLQLLPRGAHPIDAIRTGVSMLGMFDPDAADNSPEANFRKAVRILAKISTLTTSFWRIGHGEQPVAAPADLSFAGRFLYCLTAKPAQDWEVRAFNSIFILYAEHEFNASTFSARVTASTLADMHAAITSALGTLKGPLHGGANEQSLNVLNEIGSPGNVDAWVAQRLEKHEKISGFGHRVYRAGDSRVPMMRDLARELAKQFGREKMVAICEELEAVMLRRKNLCANVDLYAAPVFMMMNIPPTLNTPIFAVARAAGWCAHVMEQQSHNRLIRPRSLYNGPAPRTFAAPTA